MNVESNTFQQAFARFMQTATKAADTLKDKATQAGAIAKDAAIQFKAMADDEAAKILREGVGTWTGRQVTTFTKSAGEKIDEFTAKLPKEKGLDVIVNKTIRAAPFIAAFTLLPAAVTIAFWIGYSVARSVSKQKPLGTDFEHHMYNGMAASLLINVTKTIAKSVLTLAPITALGATLPLLIAGYCLAMADNAYKGQPSEGSAQ